MKFKHIIPITLISVFFFSGCGASDDIETTTETTTKKTITKTTKSVIETPSEIITTEPTTQETEITTSEPTTESNPIISSLQERDIKSGSGTTFIGKYLVAKIPENSFTDNDLIEFYYYCKENKSTYNYIIVDFDNGEGIWYDFELSKKKLEFDVEAGSGYIQHETLGYYNINSDNTITYEPVEEE